MLRVLRALCGVTTFLVAAAGCSFPPAFRHETAPLERSIAFEGCRQFETKLSNGTIKIQGWNQPTASISTKVWAQAYSAQSARQLAESTKVDLKRTGETVILEYVPAVSLISNEKTGVDVTVHLPADAATRAESEFGNVAASNLSGRIDMHSSYKNITLAEPRGPAQCVTTYGNIKVTGARGELACKSDYGNIDLIGAQGPVKGETEFGNITISDAQGPVNCSTSYGDVTASIGWGGLNSPGIDLRTTFGSIKLRMSPAKDR